MSERRAARLLLVDPDGRVLLLHGHDPVDATGGSWWITPGGGVEDGEELTEAARRECLEETGLVLDRVGPVVHENTVSFAFAGGWLEQQNFYFRIDVAAFEPSLAGWTEEEARTFEGWRWWSREELLASDERYYPEDLPDLLRRSGPPRR